MNQKLEKLIARYAELSGNPKAFSESMLRPPPKAFRVNTLKASPHEVSERMRSHGLLIGPLMFCREAFLTSSDATQSLEHRLGLIYFQDPASLLPVLVMQSELKTAKFVLDACAAPGSKTTHIAAIMENRGVLVANDSSSQRVRALRFNLEKAGAVNVVVTNHSLLAFPPAQFDAILLDAPCSLEGTARADPSALKAWSLKKVKILSKLQKRMILKAFDLLDQGGVMVYSTCTFAPEENEAVISHLVEKRPARLEMVFIPGFETRPGVAEWNGEKFAFETGRAARVWPHHNDTAGFFMAKVKKE
jgi:NOL1/NOP2/sun family putative RNA methylase